MNEQSMLAPYRVLDITDEKGFICGKILGDLGADVIKIEKPGGDLGRSIGPFYKDIAHPNKSLYWFAYNTSKRGITLDIESPDGRERFKRLVRGADVIIESFRPGYMDSVGLGYSELSKINPYLIMTSISPFGQSGAYKDYKASDIVIAAMAGVLYVTGDPDRPPIRISFPVMYNFAGAEAAVGTLMALYHRNQSGEGQLVDISAQWSALPAQYEAAMWWYTNKKNYKRDGGFLFRPHTGIRFRQQWPCKDGFVTFYYFGGQTGASSNKKLVEWMESEGFDVGLMKYKNWETFSYAETSQEEINYMEEVSSKFFMSHTKEELLQGALERGIMLYPMSTIKDLLENRQLIARGYWVKIQHPELDTEITYPGGFVKASETQCEIWRRAPLIGEHNKEILENEELASRESLLLQQFKGLTQNRKGSLFKDLKVLDFTWTGVGPYTVKYLSEYGAQVVKVESSLRPDPLRTLPPFKDNIVGINRSQVYARHNANKLSLALNMNHPRVREVITRLVAWADVITEAFTPGTLEKWGLGYEEVKKIKPDIIVMHTCMQGQTGPFSRHPGYGYPLASLSGFSYITGWPDRVPAGAFGPFTDFIAPIYNIVALLGALDYRRRTGKGQCLDLSQLECSMQFLTPIILDYVVNGRVFNRRGNLSSRAAPHGAYRCLGDDKWCVISCSNDEWQSFCKVVGNTDWTRDAKFATLHKRIENASKLDKLVEEWTVRHSAQEVMTLMQAEGVAAGAALTGEELLNDPQLKYYDAFHVTKHPEMGECIYQRATIKLTKCPPVETIHPPLVGEHTEFVCKHLLNMSEEDYVSLLIEDVFT